MTQQIPHQTCNHYLPLDMCFRPACLPLLNTKIFNNYLNVWSESPVGEYVMLIKFI